MYILAHPQPFVSTSSCNPICKYIKSVSTNIIFDIIRASTSTHRGVHMNQPIEILNQNYLLKDEVIKKLNINKYTLLSEIVEKHNNIQLLCPSGHKCQTSYNSFIIKRKKIKCIKCESNKYDIDNSFIDKFLEEKKSNLTRISDYPNSPYKAIRFQCKEDSKHITNLKWLNLKLRPYCKICKKTTFKHNILTREFTEFVEKTYNGKVLEKFKGYKRIIKLQCKNNHIFEKSPRNVGFKSQNGNFCTICV